MKLKLLPWIVVLAISLAPLVSEAQVQFTFDYQDTTGTGFNHDTLGAARRSALEAAATNYATAFSSYTATIEIAVSSYSLNTPTLMSAGTYYVGPNPGFGNAEATRAKILGGNSADLTTIGGVGISAEATLDVNFFYSWQLDHNTTPSGSEFDWYGVLYHEFTHMVGFSKGIMTDSDGTNSRDFFSSTNPDNTWGAFAGRLRDKNGNPIFTGTTLDNSTFESLLVGGSSPNDGLFFETNTGTLVGLYSPTTFEGGRSGSHLDINDINGTYANMMMLPSVSTGLATRTFSDIELEMLRTIGYTDIMQINAVPEPKHVVLGLGGVALIVVLARRHILGARSN